MKEDGKMVHEPVCLFVVFTCIQWTLLIIIFRSYAIVDWNGWQVSKMWNECGYDNINILLIMHANS